ncbi:hypothetical protein ACIP6T_10990 [Pantoea sp. NPDC088449]|uniref:hypothetical protein n=1 Tax=Pantoea sp. NPDC088449 TaxID=3364392 RepID=UPI00381EF035
MQNKMKYAILASSLLFSGCISSAERGFEEDNEYNRKAATYSTVSSEAEPEQHEHLTPQCAADKPVKQRGWPLTRRCQRIKNQAVEQCHGILNQPGKNHWDFLRCKNDFMMQRGCL